MRALFGYTGFVGKYISTFEKFDYLYNSKNIQKSINMSFDKIYISCIPAVKWYANKFPKKDILVIKEIKKIFNTINAKKVILISTIDVYDNINNRSDEKTNINDDKNHVYGKNRHDFEKFIKKKFKEVYIIRLPALFGFGLKKNIIFDLLNNNNVGKIKKNSKFQWYCLTNLKNDVEIILKNKLYYCNLFTEPLHTKEILYLFNYDYSNNPDKFFNYDTVTLNYNYFVNGKNGYINTKEEILEQIKDFINIYKKTHEIPYKLSISNLTFFGNKNQFLNILNLYNYNYVELAPIKNSNWKKFYNNELCNIKNDISKFNISVESLQSINYNINYNLFDCCGNEKLLLHLKKVIDISIKNKIKILVFGSPKNRFIINNTKDNKKIFINFFKKLGDYIGNNNLKICIENNSKLYNCNFLNNIKEVGEMVKEINNNNIAMVIDIGNCIMENDNINDILIYSKYIKHIHISNPFLNYFINYNKNYYKNFMNVLKKINYKGIITLEFVGKDDINNFNISLKNFKNIF